VLKKIPNVRVVGIAGPGDPFANGRETMETLGLVRERHPGMILCVATNGLDLSPYVGELARLAISHVTVTVNAVDPDVGARIYAWARLGRKIYRGRDAAAVILDRQREAVRSLKERGITLKINTVVVPGINDGHVEEVAREMAALGADIHNCIPMYHVAGTDFEHLAPLPVGRLQESRARAGAYLTPMTHCARCRADAAGMIGEAGNAQGATLLRQAASGRQTADRPYVAVASREGLFVNQHVGEAAAFWIYGTGKDGEAGLLGCRPAPPPGGGSARWAALADLLRDCRAVLASGVGPAPRTALEDVGVRVIVMEGMAREGAGALLTGAEIPKILLRQPGRCAGGWQCRGDGTGCG
jgi:nitrogen fixation protein NifB